MSKGSASCYVSRNISEGDAKPLLVWDQLRGLLSRSDALPETAQGVKEASVAWKDLASKFSNNDKKPGDGKNCPFSVDRLDPATLDDDGMMILELPCGLVEDSSISLVGIPDGPHRSFQDQLLGKQRQHMTSMLSNDIVGPSRPVEIGQKLSSKKTRLVFDIVHGINVFGYKNIL